NKTPTATSNSNTASSVSRRYYYLSPIHVQQVFFPDQKSVVGQQDDKNAAALPYLQKLDQDLRQCRRGCTREGLIKGSPEWARAWSRFCLVLKIVPVAGEARKRNKAETGRIKNPGIRGSITQRPMNLKLDTNDAALTTFFGGLLSRN
ncbi:unnamed protein product, partial [Amoebophrya sp. A25]